MFNGSSSLLGTSREGWASRRKPDEKPLKIDRSERLPAPEQDPTEGAVLCYILRASLLLSLLLSSKCPVLPPEWANSSICSSYIPPWIFLLQMETSLHDRAHLASSFSKPMTHSEGRFHSPLLWPAFSPCRIWFFSQNNSKFVSGFRKLPHSCWIGSTFPRFPTPPRETHAYLPFSFSNIFVLLAPDLHEATLEKQSRRYI